MLKLINITKDYVLKGVPTVHALKGLTLNFRRNEFVAILGASGCGKTTLLNIIGGLDRYTSGDLQIEGRSTKDYKDGDWDTYRNHSIGFVFQSYNLIPHQSIIKNVELALTIGGVSKEERHERAKRALEKVGLGGLENKKPNQLSGGQMQRVAIARALINEPEILLADEPTGALDSETSIQVMDLLKEVAKDCLVIMVTHNPDLAEAYATRIICMKDGLVTNDSNPYSDKEESTDYKKELKEPVVKANKGNKKKSSMSFITATGLSFSNLLSKIKRTILVTIAGSIGIVGVSAVLAVSQGVTDYIHSMQDGMLSSYPVEVAEQSVDMTSLLTGLNASRDKDAFHFDPKDPKVGIDSMITYLMNTYSNITNVKTNVINGELVDYIEQIPQDAIFSIYKNYGVDPTNNIFTDWVSDPYVEGQEKHHETISLNGLTQRYISELNTVNGFSRYASYVNLFTSFMKEIPADKEYILSQYDQLGESDFDESVDGITLVVDANTTLTDLVLGQLGIFEHDEFINIAKRAVKINELPDDLSETERKEAIEQIERETPYTKEFEYEDLLGKEFIYMPQGAIYAYDDKVAEDKTVVSVFGLDLIHQKIYSLEYDEDKDELNGTFLSITDSSFEPVSFIRNGDKPSEVEDIEDYILGNWTAYNSKKELIYTMTIAETMLGLSINVVDADGNAFPATFASAAKQTTQIKGFAYQAEMSAEMKANPEAYGGRRMKVNAILRLKNTKSFGCLTRGAFYSRAFANKYIEDSNKNDALLTKDFQDYFGTSEQSRGQYNAYVKFNYWDYQDDSNPQPKQGYAISLNGDLSSSFGDLFSSITGVNYVETDKVHLRSVCGYKANDITNDKGEVIDYEFALLPNEIDIYPKSFAKKDVVTKHLDKWNSEDPIQVFIGTPDQKTLDKNSPERNELTYTDTIKLIITVINTLITTITSALVAFTSLALVVSSFMIAVITYISVVERTKEIGIIRSVGGRKKDVSRLFIAETFMTGLFSGIFGIVITYIFEVIFNAVIFASFGIFGLANLTIWTALIMLGISIGLSVLSGLIPSMKASRQDPVVALRTE